MQKILMIGAVVFASLISGCDDLPSVEFERCVISLEFEACDCAMYRVSKEKVGRVSPQKLKPLEYCEDAVAIPGNGWAALYGFFIELQEEARDRD